MVKNKTNCEIPACIGVDVLPGTSAIGPGIDISGRERGVNFLLSPELLRNPDRFNSSFGEFLGYAQELVEGDVSGPEKRALKSFVEHLRRWKYDAGSRRRGHLR